MKRNPVAANGLLCLGLVLAAIFDSALAQELPNPTRFEADIAQFEAQDRINPPPAGAIVLTGSSSIARWNERAVADLAPLTVIPRGFGGSVMNDLLYYLDVASPFLNADGSVMTDVFVDDNLHHNELGTLIWGSTIRAALMPQEARYE